MKNKVAKESDLFNMTICPICQEKKSDSEMNLRKLICRNCVQKQHHAKYRERKRIENIPNRDKQLYKRYLERKERHWSVESIAKMFQISASEAYEIIAHEKTKIRAEEKLKKKPSQSARNSQIYRMYMDTNKGYSLSILARIFHITPPRVHKIIRQEENKRKALQAKNKTSRC